MGVCWGWVAGTPVPKAPENSCFPPPQCVPQNDQRNGSLNLTCVLWGWGIGGGADFSAAQPRRTPLTSHRIPGAGGGGFRAGRDPPPPLFMIKLGLTGRCFWGQGSAVAVTWIKPCTGVGAGLVPNTGRP